MGLEELKKEILDKAEEEARKITGSGKREAEEIMTKAMQEIEQSRKASEEDAARISEKIEKKALASAEFDSKKMKLDRKKEIIDKLFSEVKADLSRMDERKRESSIKKLLDRANKEIQVKYVHANANDKKIIERMKGVSYVKADITGGIVAESQDLDFSIDLSYDEILEGIRKKHLQEIAEKLFGQ